MASEWQASGNTYFFQRLSQVTIVSTFIAPLHVYLFWYGITFLALKIKQKDHKHGREAKGRKRGTRSQQEIKKAKPKQAKEGTEAQEAWQKAAQEATEAKGSRRSTRNKRKHKFHKTINQRSQSKRNEHLNR